MLEFKRDTFENAVVDALAYMAGQCFRVGFNTPEAEVWHSRSEMLDPSGHDPELEPCKPCQCYECRADRGEIEEED